MKQIYISREALQQNKLEGVFHPAIIVRREGQEASSRAHEVEITHSCSHCSHVDRIGRVVQAERPIPGTISTVWIEVFEDRDVITLQRETPNNHD